MKTTISNLILCSILLLIINSGIAQESFSKVYYEDYNSLNSYSVANTFDNSYIISGIRNNKNFILKINSKGNPVWNKVIGTRSANSHSKIITLMDSSYLLASLTYNPAYIFCLNLDTNGDTLWSTSINLDSTTVFKSIQQTFDSGFILTCGILYEDAVLSKTVIIKLSPTGELQWSKSYSDGVHVNVGNSITQTADSGYIVFGLYVGDAPNYSQTFVMKLTPEGNVSWINKYIMASTIWDKWYEQTQTEDGFLFATLDLRKLVLMKTDFSGNVMWAKKYYTNSFDFVVNRIKIQELSNGNIVLLAPDNFIKIDSLGNIIWAKEVMMHVSDVVESPDNGFLIIGNGPLQGVNLSGSDYPQIGVIKTDSLGQGDSDCIYDVPITVENKTIVANPTFLTTENVGSISQETIQLSSTILTVETGCVTVITKIDEDIFENNINVFPNPSEGIINIQIAGFEQLKNIEIHNILGDKIYQYNDKKTKEVTIDLSKMPSGIYILKVECDNNNLYTSKILLN